MVKELTQTEVKNLFDYIDGELVWKNPKSNRIKKGDVAGAFKDGYRRISIDYALYYAHRLVWLYHYGKMPMGVLDHVDMNRANNRVENLREVTTAQNSMNRLKTKSNRSGFKGVSFHKGTQKWRASCAVNGKQKYLGLYVCPEDAHAAYVQAVKEHHEEYGRS